MKAIVQSRYGAPEDVLSFAEVPDPVPGPGQVLVRIRAASVNPADWHIVRGEPVLVRPTLGRPKGRIPGYDLAGVVEAVGSDVTAFHPGDEVYADPETGCFAELIAVDQDLLATKPANLSFEEAAAVPLGALTALQGLRDHAHLETGQRLLVIGASGGVGSFAVQIGVALGAEVTGVCSTSNLELVRSLGAIRTIDYIQEDPLATGDRYDVILQLGGTATARACRRALTPTGTLLSSSGDAEGRWLGPLTRMIGAVALDPFVSQRLKGYLAKGNGRDLVSITELIEGGKVRPVIDRTYPLVEAAEAISYVERGHTRGKVVVTV